MCSGPVDCAGSLLDTVTGLPGDIAGSVAGSAIDALAKAVQEAVGKVIVTLGTLWVKVGTPNLTTSDGGTTPSDAVGFIQGSLWWYMAAAAVLAVIVGGTRMAWEHKAEPGRDLVKALLTLIVVAGAGLTAIALLVSAADAFSQWIINRSTEGTDFGANMTKMLALGGVSGVGALDRLVDDPLRERVGARNEQRDRRQASTGDKDQRQQRLDELAPGLSLLLPRHPRAADDDGEDRSADHVPPQRPLDEPHRIGRCGPAVARRQVRRADLHPQRAQRRDDLADGLLHRLGQRVDRAARDAARDITG